LRETKCPDRGIILVAPFKRRGSPARRVGFRDAYKTGAPEADDIAEETNLVEGGSK